VIKALSNCIWNSVRTSQVSRLLLALTRAWTLVRFVDSGMLQLSACNCCGGTFITHAHQPLNNFVCSLCQPPSRAVKRRKLSPQLADIIPQLLDEQVKRAI
jgi:flagellar transcriptional activator FlhC